MPNFESGVAKYIHGRTTVDVYFPVDYKGNAAICCEQCFYYRKNYRSCALNGEICAYPSRYVGAACPLEFVDE